MQGQLLSPFPSSIGDRSGAGSRPDSRMISTASGAARRAGTAGRDAISSTGSRGGRSVSLPLDCRRLTEGVPLYAAMRVPANEATEVLSPVERPTLFLRSFDAAKALHGDRNKLPDSEAAVVVKYIVAAARAPVVAYYRDDPDGFNQIARVVAQSTESERQAEARRVGSKKKSRSTAQTGGNPAFESTSASTGSTSGAPAARMGATVTFSEGFPMLADPGTGAAGALSGAKSGAQPSAKLRTGLDATAVPPHPDLRKILGSSRASLMLRRLVDGGVDGLYLPLDVLVEQGNSVLVDGKSPPPPPSAVPADPFAKPAQPKPKGGRRGAGTTRQRQSDLTAAGTPSSGLAQGSVPRLALGMGDAASAGSRPPAKGPAGAKSGSGSGSGVGPSNGASAAALASADHQVLLLLRPHLHVVPHKVCILGRGRDEARVALHFIATPTIDAAALTLGLPQQPKPGASATGGAPAADEAAQHAAVPPVFLGDGSAFMVAAMAEARTARALREATLKNDEAAIAAMLQEQAEQPVEPASTERSAAPGAVSVPSVSEQIAESALVRQCREARQASAMGGGDAAAAGKSSSRKSSARGGKASSRGKGGGDADESQADKEKAAKEGRKVALAGKALTVLAEELVSATRATASDSASLGHTTTGAYAVVSGRLDSSRANLDADAAAAIGLDADAAAEDSHEDVPLDVQSMLPEVAQELEGRVVMLARPDVTSIEQMLKEAVERRPSLKSLLQPRLQPTAGDVPAAAGKGDKSARLAKASARSAKASSRGSKGGETGDAAAAGEAGQSLMCEVWMNGRKSGSIFRWDTAAGTAAVR